MRFIKLIRDVRDRLFNGWNQVDAPPPYESTPTTTTVLALETDTAPPSPTSLDKEPPIIITSCEVEESLKSHRKTVAFAVPSSELCPAPARAPPAPPFPVLLAPEVISSISSKRKGPQGEGDELGGAATRQGRFPRMSMISKIFWLSLAALPLSGYAAKTTGSGGPGSAEIILGCMSNLVDTRSSVAPTRSGCGLVLLGRGFPLDINRRNAGNNSAINDPRE